MFELQKNQNHSYFSLHQESFTSTPVAMDKKSKQCEICNQFLNIDQFQSLSKCEHEYCKECLKYYTLHKIKNQFSAICCPKDNCKKQIDQEGETYANLPQNLKIRYKRILNNLKQLSNPSFRICPHCEQTQLSLMKNDRQNYFCTKCVKSYCKICLNPAHRKYAKCDNVIVGMLKRNFQFKRCYNCSFIVQKNEGCNHMTCKCGAEFCYLCGGYWDHGNHVCPNPSIKRKIFNRPAIVVKERPVRTILKIAATNIVFDDSFLLSKQIKMQRPTRNIRPSSTYKTPNFVEPKKIYTSRVSTKQHSLIIKNKSILLFD